MGWLSEYGRKKVGDLGKGKIREGNELVSGSTTDDIIKFTKPHRKVERVESRKERNRNIYINVNSKSTMGSENKSVKKHSEYNENPVFEMLGMQGGGWQSEYHRRMKK